MDRRKALKITGAGGLGAILAAGAAPAFSQGKKEWRMQQTWGKTAPGLARGGNVFAEYVTKATGGSRSRLAGLTSRTPSSWGWCTNCR